MYRRLNEDVICSTDEPLDFEWEEFEETAESYNPDQEDGSLRRSIAEPPVVATSD